MKIIDIKHIDMEGDGIVINEFIFDSTISKKFIDYIGGEGEIQFFNPPIYKVSFNNDFIIRGIEGTNTARIYFYKNIKENLLKVKELINNFRPVK